MTNIIGANVREIKAALVHKTGDPFEIGTLHLEAPRVDEVLVRIVATGICQTDAHVRDQEYQTPLLCVLHAGEACDSPHGRSVRVCSLRPQSHRKAFHVRRSQRGRRDIRPPAKILF